MSESNQPLRVTTACDQPIFLRGMVGILQTIKGVQLVGEAQSGDDAFQLCKLTQPDLLLLDLKDALEARRIASAIHQECGQVRIILLHSCPDEDPGLEDRVQGILVGSGSMVVAGRILHRQERLGAT